MSKPAETAAVKVIATNRKASHEFHIHERVEAGLVLVGSEVKSLRDAKVVIQDGWAAIEKGEGWLYGVQINEYPWANRWNHEPTRTRKLLLHRREIDRLDSEAKQSGYTIVPLSLYDKRGMIKVQLGLARGKRQYDKREALAAREAQRDIERAIRDAERGR